MESSVAGASLAPRAHATLRGGRGLSSTFSTTAAAMVTYLPADDETSRRLRCLQALELADT
ncbi:hypothetical protein ABT115_15015 [Streptomyces sp. NPDC001832]|uniref:hypothetical protein n=1 Tax=Streptomyces sp. NPDC001832 TaxID=3154527 RepID=UPI003320143E